jgi:hypothetical protein
MLINITRQYGCNCKPSPTEMKEIKGRTRTDIITKIQKISYNPSTSQAPPLHFPTLNTVCFFSTTTPLKTPLELQQICLNIIH